MFSWLFKKKKKNPTQQTPSQQTSTIKTSGGKTGNSPNQTGSLSMKSQAHSDPVATKQENDNDVEIFNFYLFFPY